MILQDLYNKVIGFFRQTDIEQEETSKETACNRLRVVLMQDRTNLTPELMERMRKEMVELLSKYVEMDKEALELNLEQDGDQVALMLSIPVIRAKDEEEIAACEQRAQDAHGDDESAEQSEDPFNASKQEKKALEEEDARKEVLKEKETDDVEEETDDDIDDFEEEEVIEIVEEPEEKSEDDESDEDSNESEDEEK